MFRHIVLFKLRDNISQSQQEEALGVLRNLEKSNVGIIEWTVEMSTDTRKGTIIIENGLFQDKNSYVSFRTSDEHVKAGEYMSQISDWWIGDYLE